MKMGKRAKRYFTTGKNEKSAASSKKKRNEMNETQERPDPESRNFYYDEVDEFHHEREKVYLDRVRARSPVSSDEEVFGIGSENEEEEMGDDEPGEQEEMDDMQSDISGEDDDEQYLPGADAWGKRRKAYYSTDFIGDDKAGLSGSDVEVAELEEREAISLQKRLMERMTEEDFKLDEVEKANESRQKGAQSVQKQVVETDLSSLTDEEKVELLKQQSPELLPLIEEYKEKSKMAKENLGPVANAILEMDGDNEKKSKKEGNFKWILNKYDLYMNYLLNLRFYFILKAMRHPVDNHPVIDRIMSLRKLVDDMDEKYSEFDGNVKKLAKQVKSGSSIKTALRSLSVPIKSVPKLDKEHSVEKSKKRVHWDVEDGKTTSMEDSQSISNEIEDGELERRGVTYEIEKNKGLTPNRKKEQRNPRVKNRMRFKKAVHKKKSQIPDARREIQKYGGEIRGIKANLVRSVKLH